MIYLKKLNVVKVVNSRAEAEALITKGYAEIKKDKKTKAPAETPEETSEDN